MQEGYEDGRVKSMTGGKYMKVGTFILGQLLSAATALLLAGVISKFLTHDAWWFAAVAFSVATAAIWISLMCEEEVG
jgi:hypothetical protein